MKSKARRFMCFWVGMGLSFGTWAQVTVTEVPTVEIHQIGVDAGDATFIKVNAVGRTYCILIDAGYPGYASGVREYIWSGAAAVMDSTHPYLDLVITSHYDADHMGGMVGSRSHWGILDGKRGERAVNKMKIPYYVAIDPGTLPGPEYKTGVVSPPPLYSHYCDLANYRRIPVGPASTNSNFRIPTKVGTTDTFPLPDTANLRLGGVISLGADANGVQIKLRLITANGYQLNPSNSKPFKYDDVATTRGKTRAAATSGNNNNWCLGWILEYGQFRYFTGGDLPGYNSGNLFNMETPLANAMPKILPAPAKVAGHVCVMKANHHGAEESTNDAILAAMKPSLIGFSCGSRHGHPRQEVIDRIYGCNWPDTEYGYSKPQLLAFTSMKKPRNFHSLEARISGNQYLVNDAEYIRDDLEDADAIGSGQPVVTPILGTKRKRSFTVVPAKPTRKQRTILTEFIRDYTDENLFFGDFKVLVYPQVGDKRISDESNYSFVRKAIDKDDWITPEKIKCH